MKKGKPKIQFHILTQVTKLNERIRLKSFLVQLFELENSPLKSLDYIFCSDEYLIELNKKHLNHDTYTDIITFALNNETEPIEGDIYISIERVNENASDMGISKSFELHRVIFHGALHLCGYKDKTQKDLSLMRQKEEYYLALYFVSRETI